MVVLGSAVNFLRGIVTKSFRTDFVFRSLPISLLELLRPRVASKQEDQNLKHA
jgi:hypothetical protein